MFSIELHGVKFSAGTVSDVIALVKAFKSSPSLEERGNSQRVCIAHAMSRGASSQILSKLGQVTATATESAAHVLSTVSENALPLVEQAASLILDKTATFSECLGDNLYRLAKASKTTSARHFDCTVKADRIGPGDPTPVESVAPANSSIRS